MDSSKKLYIYTTLLGVNNKIQSITYLQKILTKKIQNRTQNIQQNKPYLVYLTLLLHVYDRSGEVTKKIGSKRQIHDESYKSGDGRNRGVAFTAMVLMISDTVVAVERVTIMIVICEFCKEDEEESFQSNVFSKNGLCLEKL